MIGKAHTVETTFAAHPPLAHKYIHRSMCNEKVFKFWKIAPCSIEFRIRRIRMWQSFLRQPHQHVQVNAAMFGKLIFEADPLDHKGETTTQTHACLRMLEIDINILSDNTDEGASLGDYIKRKQGINTLIYDPEAREMFIAIDPAQLRARYFSVSIPPPGYVAPSTINYCSSILQQARTRPCD